jgi:hypothetical protein
MTAMEMVSLLEQIWFDILLKKESVS